MEPATEGSVDAPAVADAPAGTPDVQPAVVDNGSAAPADTDPFSGLSEGTRKWVETKGYKSPEDIATAYMNAEQKLGASVTVPKEDAPKEEWDKFYSRLPEAMRPPESPDKYEFARPEGLPEDLPYNQEMADVSKTWMHEAGLNGKQAQAIHDRFAGYMADQQKQALAAQAEAVEATHADLTKEWGPTDSEGFKAKQELASRAAKKLGLMESFQKGGLVLADGAMTDPQLAKALSVVGETMFKEDTIGNDPLAVGGNPFKRDNAGNRNLSGINSLVKNDPERAKRLAREAGEDPKKWGLR